MAILSPRQNVENKTSKLEMNEENKTICTKTLKFNFKPDHKNIESNQSLDLEGVIQNQEAKLLIWKTKCQVCNRKNIGNSRLSKI